MSVINKNTEQNTFSMRCFLTAHTSCLFVITYSDELERWTANKKITSVFWLSFSPACYLYRTMMSRMFYFYHNHQLEPFKPPRTDTTVSLRMLINFIIHLSLTDACYSDFFVCSKRTLSHALLNLYAMFPQCSLLGSSEISHMQSGRTMTAEDLLSSLWIPVFIYFFRQKVYLFII